MATYEDLEAEINAQIDYLQTYKTNTRATLDQWEADLTTKHNSVLSTADNGITDMNTEKDTLIAEIQLQIDNIRSLKANFETKVNQLSTDLQSAYDSTVASIDTKKIDTINLVDAEGQSSIDYMLNSKTTFESDIAALQTDLETAVTNAKASITTTKDNANVNITNKADEAVTEVQSQVDYLQSYKTSSQTDIEATVNQGLTDIQAKIDTSITDLNTIKNDAQTALNDAKYATSLVDEKGTYAQEQGDYAKRQGDYLSTAINNAKEMAETNKVYYKGTAPSFEQIPYYFSSPQVGWTVITEDTNARYRYSGSEWQFIGNVSEGGMVVSSIAPDNSGYIWIDTNE